jgi:hypothetical protein
MWAAARRRGVRWWAPAAAAAAAATVARAAAADDGVELLGRRVDPVDALRSWRAGTTLDHINRAPPDALDPRRRVIVVAGITGAGKSSTANTLSGRTHKPFEQSSSVASVTQSVSHRDYDFVGERWRVVDTPGLCDTNRDAGDVRAELARLAQYSPHGVSAFVLVVPRGRFTAEQEHALRQILALLGDGAARFSMLAVTSATDDTENRHLLSRDALAEEIGRLPLHHFYRALVEELRYRLVPVENRLDPHHQLSRMGLHQRVLDLEAELAGARFDTQHLATAAARGPATAAPAEVVTLPLPHTLALEPCTQAVERVTEDAAHDGQLQLTIRCRLRPSTAVR